jgi:hypothetical protein
MVRRSRRKMRGGSIMSWIKSANRFLKKHKILSTAGSLIGKTGLPYASQIAKAGKVAGVMGYGRRGRGVTPTGGMYRRRKGGALRLAGAGHRRKCKR